MRHTDVSWTKIKNHSLKPIFQDETHFLMDSHHLSYRIRSRFTLIELLVVIAIIIVLAGILLPVFGQARAKAKRTKCLGQLTQFGLAIVMYRDDSDNLMPAWLSSLHGDYVSGTQMYICPDDPSAGFDGSRPGAGWPDNKSGGSAISINFMNGGSRTSPDGSPDQYDIKDPKLVDEFFNTDDTDRNPDRDTGDDAVERCSYLYEFADVECTWASQPTFKPDSKGELTWYTVKQQQMEQGLYYDGGWKSLGQQWDPVVFPAVRCFHHWDSLWGSKELCLNTSYDGGYFESNFQWEEGHF